jgi:hypothetical protein
LPLNVTHAEPLPMGPQGGAEGRGWNCGAAHQA